MAAGRDDPLWPVIHAGAERYRAYGGSFPVRYLVPTGDTPQDQNALLASLAEKDLRGVCVHIRDAAAIQSSLRELHDSGTVIVSIGAPGPQELRSAHVGFDEAGIGRMLADAVNETLVGESTLMLMHAGLKDPVYGPRLWAFRDRIRLHAKLEVLAELDCAADPVQSLERMRELSRRYPRLSAWVCLGDWPLRQIANPSAAMLGLPPNCKLVTFGGWPSHWPLIQSGTMPAVVTLGDGELGDKALLFCESALLSKQPKRVEDRHAIPPRLLRAQDLDAWMKQWGLWSGMSEAGPSSPPLNAVRP